MPDCWLAVSLYPEDPVTGQLDQGFSWFSLVIEQILSLYPNPTAPLASHAAIPMVTSTFRPNEVLPMSYKN
jgi:hypothetical protein